MYGCELLVAIEALLPDITGVRTISRKNATLPVNPTKMGRVLQHVRNQGQAFPNNVIREFDEY